MLQYLINPLASLQEDQQRISGTATDKTQYPRVTSVQVPFSLLDYHHTKVGTTGEPT